MLLQLVDLDLGRGRALFAPLAVPDFRSAQNRIRIDRVDADAGFRAFQRQATGEMDLGRLGCAIGSGVGRGGKAVLGSDENDVAAEVLRGTAGRLRAKPGNSRSRGCRCSCSTWKARCSSIGADEAMPAFDTRMSMPPNSTQASAKDEITPSSLVTSSLTLRTASPPNCLAKSAPGCRRALPGRYRPEPRRHPRRSAGRPLRGRCRRRRR
jgi:hypothetical protein